jgi:predicted ATPase
MSGPGLGRVTELFFAALEVAPEERASFLDAACGGDAALRAEVDRLVAADAAAGSLFDAPLGDVFRKSATPPPAEPPAPPIPRGLRPQYLASFVGREREVGEVKGLLAENRLLTLMGAAGIGKTRLALRVAEEAAPLFGGRVRFVEVSTIEDPACLGAEVARALGIEQTPDQSLESAVRAEMPRKRFLLVLDGCERLAEACATVAEAVLHAGARARVLATSRESLGVPGEAVWYVPPLSVPVEGGDVAASESVRLFVERVRLQKPDFELGGRTMATIAAVAELCRRLDGIPLALELAAARIRTMPVEQMVAKLDEPFRLLSGGGRNASPRHRGMRAAIDWTYERLTPAEKHLFCRLSSLEGSWTLKEAENVYGRADEQNATSRRPSSPAKGLQPLMERLVETSLLLAEERGGESLYRMYGIVRAYAREKLADGSGDRDASPRVC